MRDLMAEKKLRKEEGENRIYWLQERYLEWLAKQVQSDLFEVDEPPIEEDETVIEKTWH